jgi:hypothetical protein
MTPTRIALGFLAWTLLALAVGLIIGALVPRSPEPDEHEACAGDPEILRAVGEPGVINHFHNGSL